MTSDIRFIVDWEPAPHVRSPVLRATWARLEIWVGGDCITQVEDAATGSVRRSIYCSLYPLAEWISYSWWFLVADSRPAILSSRAWSHGRLSTSDRSNFRWLERHNLRSAAEGFAWPDLTLVPEGRSVRSVWKRDHRFSESRPIRFLSEGEQSIDADAVRLALAQLVNQTLARLAEQNVPDSALLKEWSAIDESDPEEIEFCVAAARLGLDPYGEAEVVAGELQRAASALPGILLEDFLNAVEPDQIGGSLDWISSASARIARSSTQTALAQLVELVSEGGDPATADALPWDVGWAEARQVRDALSLASAAVFDPAAYVPARVFHSPDHGLQAVGGLSKDESALLVLGGTLGDGARRFSQGRSLWHFLFDRGRSRRFLLTPSRTDRQKVERAFAAELLAPAEGIRQQLPVDPVKATAEDIDAAAAHFRVSPLLVRHQVENQLVAA